MLVTSCSSIHRKAHSEKHVIITTIIINFASIISSKKKKNLKVINDPPHLKNNCCKSHSPFTKKPKIQHITDRMKSILCLSLVVVSKQLDCKKRSSIDRTKLFIPLQSYFCTMDQQSNYISLFMDYMKISQGNQSIFISLKLMKLAKNCVTLSLIVLIYKQHIFQLLIAIKQLNKQCQYTLFFLLFFFN